MRILSESAIDGGAIRCPVWNTSHTADFMIHVRGDATLTIGPYGSPGTCIVNCVISQFTDRGERDSTYTSGHSG